MISARYYGNWLREAGRGHIAAILCWGGFLPYLVLKLTELGVDTDYTFFGIGSRELYFLCAGLGLGLAFAEFFYFFQGKKQDFYYSLPVKKSTIFWSRYVHGLIQFTVPLLAAMIICVLFEAGQDEEFALYAVSYLGRSAGMALLIFLLFYHIALFASAVSGKIITAIFVAVGLIFYFEILVQSVLQGFARMVYRSYYRIPFLEEMGNILIPEKLAGKLAGTDLYEKKEVLEYLAEGKYIFAVFVWIVFLLGMAVMIHKGRRTEMTGKVFTSVTGERAAEIMMSVLAGLLLGILVMNVTHSEEKGMMIAVILLCVSGVAGAAAMHFLLECLVMMPKKEMFRRKWQMLIEVAGVCIVVLAFWGSQDSFDSFVPENSQIMALSVSVQGIDMEQERYEAMGEEENYVTDERLRRYTMREEGLKAGMDWIRKLKADEAAEINGGTDKQVTTAVVCYQMKDGGKRYRVYPVTEKALDWFADVYETREYKKNAYPLMAEEKLGNERLTWSDGVTSSVMKLSREEKEKFLETYKNDVNSMEMPELKHALPIGVVKIDSEIRGVQKEAVIYPFFEETCRFLEENGIETDKTLRDYEIISVKVQGVEAGISGRTSLRFYDEAEEISEWSGRLVPEKLAIQPLLRPVNTAVQAEVGIEDKDTSSVTVVECYGTGE